MNRVGAVAYLASRFHKIALFCDVPEEDTALGYGAEIDAALRELGVSETDLTTYDVTDKVRSYTTLLDYFALRKLNTDLSLSVDYAVNSNQINEKASQYFTQTASLLAKAEEDCNALGYLNTADKWPSGWVTTDYIEGSSDD